MNRDSVMPKFAWLVVLLVWMPTIGFAAQNQSGVKKPAIAVITDLGPHLFDFTLPDTVAKISVFEQWALGHAAPANEHSAVSFRVRYTVQHTNALTSSRGIATTDFVVDPPAMTRTATLDLPLTDVWGAPLEEGTYRSTITAAAWEETPGNLQWVGEAATSTTVFYVTREHGAYTIATPELPSAMLMPVENSADTSAEFVTYKTAGAIIPAGAVAEPMLFTLDKLDPIEHPELDFVGRAGPFLHLNPRWRSPFHGRESLLNRLECCRRRSRSALLAVGVRLLRCLPRICFVTRCAGGSGLPLVGRNDVSLVSLKESGGSADGAAPALPTRQRASSFRPALSSIFRRYSYRFAWE